MSARSPLDRRGLEEALGQIRGPRSVVVLTILNVTMRLDERQAALAAGMLERCAKGMAVGTVGNDHVAAVAEKLDELLDHANGVVRDTQTQFADPPLITSRTESPHDQDVLWNAIRQAEATRQVRWHQMFAEELSHATSVDELANYILAAAVSLHHADSAFVAVGASTWGTPQDARPAGEVGLTRPDGAGFGRVTWWGGVQSDTIPGYVAVAGAEFSAAFIHLMDLERVENSLRTDSLTGLLSRQGLATEVARLASGFCVAFVDIDKFKAINDDFGHEAGDDAIRATADILRRLRRSDLVARWGGDEFVLVLPAATLTEAQARLRAHMDPAALEIHGRPYTLSIGVAEASGAPSFDEALLAADRAMYEAKRAGGGSVVAKEF